MPYLEKGKERLGISCEFHMWKLEPTAVENKGVCTCAAKTADATAAASQCDLLTALIWGTFTVKPGIIRRITTEWK